MSNVIKQKTSQFKHLLKRYKLAKDGVAAIEFVFIAPVMIFMYFGLAEISLAISADRRISHATNVMGDLTTQLSTIDSDEISEIMTAATLIMGIPEDRLNEVVIEISSYSKDINDNLVPLGKATLGGNLPTAFNAEELDPLILSSTSGVVVARVAYEYEPLKLRYFNSNFTMSETFLLKPRQSANVDFVVQDGSLTDFTCGFRGGKRVICQPS